MRMFVGLALPIALAACGQARDKQPTNDLVACEARGGYESQSAFGFPICQTDFADGGKICTDSADCRGACRLEDDGEAELPAIGAPASGVCQSKDYQPGCYALIENGVVGKDGVVCAD